MPAKSGEQEHTNVGAMVPDSLVERVDAIREKIGSPSRATVVRDALGMWADANEKKLGQANGARTKKKRNKKKKG